MVLKNITPYSLILLIGLVQAIGFGAPVGLYVHAPMHARLY